MAQLICRDLKLGYEGRVVADGISFSVNRGEYLCILGENGSGKSTLMKTVLGLHRPMGGSVEFGDGLQRNRIGYLPQQSEFQKDFPATVREIVLSGCLNQCGARPFYSKKQKEKTAQNIEKMNIAHLADRCYRELSGGQQQRVLLARALCATEELLLLDEPVSGLDPQSTEEMYAQIQSLHRSGVTVLMITHDVPAALKYADRILHLGKDFFFGSKEEYLHRTGGEAV